MNKLVHASTIAINGRAVVIYGASGSGKSNLALQLIALGAGLIADDQTLIELRNNTLWACKPDTLPNEIEARGIGLIPAPMTAACQVALAIDLDKTQSDRLPTHGVKEIFGQKITVWRNVPEPHFPAAIFVYLSNMSKPPQT